MTSSADQSQVCIVGAGPAGLAAAVEAARCGARVVLADAGPRFGGQFWRHSPAGLSADADLHHDSKRYQALDSSARKFIAAGQIDYRPSHQVWSLSVGESGCTVNAMDVRDPSRPLDVVVRASHLILAAGAYDRQLMFPGCDLPGVMTAGGAQALLKGSGVVVGPRVVVAGTGPFLLPVAAGLAARGATVVGVHEASHPRAWLRHWLVLAGQPHTMLEAGQYAAVLARHRVPVHTRSVVVAAHGSGRLESVTVAELDRSGTVRPASRRQIPADVLAVGWGFTAQTELPVAAGCDLGVSADGSPRVVTDDNQATSNPRVFAAGEASGVGGSRLAVAEGRIAGAAAARAAGYPAPGRRADLAGAYRARPRLRRFAAAIASVYPVRPTWIESLTPQTVICRCEEVTVADIDTAVSLGARDAHSAKVLSRAGMGWCQGRTCGYATTCLVAARLGQLPDLTAGSERPVAAPVPLGLLAEPTEPSTDH